MRNTVLFVLAALTLLLSTEANDSAFARGVEDWRVGPVEVGGLVWGKQERRIEISNLSGDYKFLTVNCRAISTKHGYSRPRTFKSNYIVFPKMDTVLMYVIDVPENIAPVQVEISVHDVIDTLDDISWGVELVKSEARYEVTVPPGIEEYKNRIPRATGATRFSVALGSDLRLLTNYWLKQGKTVDEIGEIAGMSAREIRKFASDMRRDSLVQVVDGKILSTINLIEGLPYAAIEEQVAGHSAAFASKLTELLPQYDAKLAELANAGSVTGDRDDAFEGTAFLYHHYPIIGGVVLWENLAIGFVSADTAPPVLIDLSNPCTRNSKEFDYFLIDRVAPDGWHMYLSDSKRNRSVFGAHVPSLDCGGARVNGTQVNFRFPRNNQPVYFNVSKERTAVALAALVEPMLPLRNRFVSDISGLFSRNGIELTPAIRFWLWNQLASRTLKTLVDDKTIENFDQKFFVWNTTL